VPDAETSCQLYVVVETGESAPDRLAAAFSAADIASVLIVPPTGRTLEAAAAKPLVELSRQRGAATLILGDALLARTLAADGVHIGSSSLGGAADLSAAYQAARSALGPDGVIGIEAGISRHDAMTMAEAGADYLAFGAPDHLKDRDKARVRRGELIEWWGEIFQVPCVAFDVESAEEAQALAEAGADFVAITLHLGLALAATSELLGASAAAVRLHASAS
jgi:thiamine-phosphate pyrophosphorylase